MHSRHSRFSFRASHRFRVTLPTINMRHSEISYTLTHSRSKTHTYLPLRLSISKPAVPRSCATRLSPTSPDLPGSALPRHALPSFLRRSPAGASHAAASISSSPTVGCHEVAGGTPPLGRLLLALAWTISSTETCSPLTILSSSPSSPTLADVLAPTLADVLVACCPRILCHGCPPKGSLLSVGP